MIYPTTVIEHGDQLRIYSGGSRDLHHQYAKTQFERKGAHPPTSVLLHTLRKDGFMYLASKGNWASLTTKPLAVFAPDLRVNVLAPHGEVDFQVTDLLSKPLKGFTFDDCVPMREIDAIDAPVRFRDKADLAELQGKPIRLEMRFRHARIHAVRGQFHWLDALDVALLMDGKPIDRDFMDY